MTAHEKTELQEMIRLEANDLRLQCKSLYRPRAIFPRTTEPHPTQWGTVWHTPILFARTAYDAEIQCVLQDANRVAGKRPLLSDSTQML